MMSASQPAQLKGERPCSTCGLCEKDNLEVFFVRCCICDRFWHNACLYTRVPQNEILLRNKKDPRGRGGGWKDWKCRQCRGLGPEGREHRRRNQIDLTLDDDDEIEIIPPAPTRHPAGQASTSRALPRPEPAPGPPPLQIQAPQRPSSPEIIELDDDDDEIIQISPSSDEHPQVGLPPEPAPLIEPPDAPPQDQPMFDMNGLSLDERPPTPPPPEFPSFAKCIDAPKRPFGSMSGTRRPGPSLPPALRGSGRTVLGQRVQDIVTSDKLVQSLGLKGLKAVGWRVEKRERIASEPPVIPEWARPPNDKGKGRDPRERRSQPITEFRLLPPRLRNTEIKSGSESYPPRKPRKSTVALHRDSTVKLEPIDLSFS